jgi:hypothetical protein
MTKQFRLYRSTSGGVGWLFGGLDVSAGGLWFGTTAD